MLNCTTNILSIRYTCNLLSNSILSNAYTTKYRCQMVFSWKNTIQYSAGFSGFFSSIFYLSSSKFPTDCVFLYIQNCVRTKLLNASPQYYVATLKKIMNCFECICRPCVQSQVFFDQFFVWLFFVREFSKRMFSLTCLHFHCTTFPISWSIWFLSQ